MNDQYRQPAYTIKIRGRKYVVQHVTGVVTGLGKDFAIYTICLKLREANTKKKTPSAVRITTTTRTFDHIFLAGNNGEERSMETKNFDIVCREGHRLTEIWFTRQHNQTSRLIAIINNTTRQVFFSLTEVNKIFELPLMMHLLIIATFFLSGCIIFEYIKGSLIGLASGFIMAYIISKIMGRSDSKKFMELFRKEILNKNEIATLQLSIII